MKFETKIFEEPHLEFGDKHHHPDPRLGLFEAGPLQIPAGDVVKIAVVGSSKTVEDTTDFFREAAAGFAGNGEKHPNLHPDFPGLGNQNPFRCKFEIDDGATAAISQSKIDKIRQEPNHAKAVEMAVGEIIQQLETLSEGSHRPDVAIIALPVGLIERVWNAKVDSKATTEKGDSGGSDAPDFRGMLKAKAMGLSFPIQIVWEEVFDEAASIPRKVKESRARKIQDQADRTWNLMTTLYYKGTGRIPWRKMQQDGAYSPLKDRPWENNLLAVTAQGRLRDDDAWCACKSNRHAEGKLLQYSEEGLLDGPNWAGRPWVFAVPLRSLENPASVNEQIVQPVISLLVKNESPDKCLAATRAIVWANSD